MSKRASVYPSSPIPNCSHYIFRICVRRKVVLSTLSFNGRLDFLEKTSHGSIHRRPPAICRLWRKAAIPSRPFPLPRPPQASRRAVPRFRNIPRKRGDHRGRNTRLRGRFFYPRCRSSVFGRTGEEIEVNLGSLDAPRRLPPTYARAALPVNRRARGACRPGFSNPWPRLGKTRCLLDSRCGRCSCAARRHCGDDGL